MEAGKVLLDTVEYNNTEQLKEMAEAQQATRERNAQHLTTWEIGWAIS